MIRFAVTFGLTLSSFLLACGGSPSPRVSASSDANAANVVAKASEPRSSDATAASPLSPVSPPPAPSTNGGAFANIGMTGTSPTAADPASGPVNTNPPPKRIGARHVLVMYMGADHAPTSVVRSREQALSVAQEVLKRARAKEDFARLAVEYSDEPNAGQRGGSLGRFGHGQMVPAFEEAAFKLQVGEISNIVESPFGYHVIQRTE